MSGAIGIDMGGTGSRYVVLDANGHELARGTAAGATGHLFNPEARVAFVAVLDEIAAALAPRTDLSAAFAGVTGLGPRAFDDAKAIIAKALNLSPASTRCSDDMELAYRAAFAPGAGHLITAGTGSVGLHIDTRGRSIRVGGRGILIDDGGSGAWIALRALDRLYRLIDEMGSTTQAPALAQAVFAAIGGDDWDSVRAYIYAGDRGRIGALARHVAAAAEEGDPLAKEVMAGAVRELARLGTALIARAGENPIGYVGRVLTLTPGFKDELVAALAPHRVVFPQIDPALTAARLARD